jgi:sugar lactone lactonase YvrE
MAAAVRRRSEEKKEKSLIMDVVMIYLVSRRVILAVLIAVVSAIPAAAQEFAAGEPIGANNEDGVWQPMSDNVTVYGSFHFSESCTFDPNKNLILAMNTGNRGDAADNDGFVSLINPDGSVHTPKWIGATRDGLELHDPLGSAVSNGVLYTVDSGHVRLFDLETGRPLRSIPVPESTILNGIAVADDGTVYASNTRNPEQIWKVTAGGEVSVFAEGAPLAAPNGVAIDQDGNIVVVNVGDNAIITYNEDGAVVRIEHSVEGGNDGIVITADGTKYASSVRYGSVSRIPPGQEAEVIASGIPSAASMCYDSTQNQLVIPLNSNYALAFVRLNGLD